MPSNSQHKVTTKDISMINVDEYSLASKKYIVQNVA